MNKTCTLKPGILRNEMCMRDECGDDARHAMLVRAKQISGRSATATKGLSERYMINAGCIRSVDRTDRM